MVETELGKATIVYEHPHEGTVERTVQNEHLAYFQDHWILKTDEDDQGRDTVRRIPIQRVHYVERTVEEFESEISSLRRQVESLADDVRSKLRGTETETEAEPSESIEIQVEQEDSDATGSTDR